MQIWYIGTSVSTDRVPGEVAKKFKMEIGFNIVVGNCEEGVHEVPILLNDRCTWIRVVVDFYRRVTSQIFVYVCLASHRIERNGTY